MSTQTVFFAIPATSVCINGITYLELNVETIKQTDIDSIVKHIKLTFKHLSAASVEEIIEGVIDQNERMFMSKMLVGVSAPPVELVELERLQMSSSKDVQEYLNTERENVYKELDKRFPREE